MRNRHLKKYEHDWLKPDDKVSYESEDLKMPEVRYCTCTTSSSINQNISIARLRNAGIYDGRDIYFICESCGSRK